MLGCERRTPSRAQGGQARQQEEEPVLGGLDGQVEGHAHAQDDGQQVGPVGAGQRLNQHRQHEGNVANGRGCVKWRG